ncbi:MAG TPA: homocysteine S-methyltransferase family protein [Treponemataceae bacterium]|nr:homocysteine S-methyltransferase family protein [Treponemataceae bacterium]
MNFRDALKDGFVFFDGSMGALLDSYRDGSRGPGYEGLSWSVPEELNLSRPDLVADVHRRYLDAGARVVLTNTFGANRIKLAGHGLDAVEATKRAVGIARTACDGRTGSFVAFDIGPTGKLLEPMGSLTFDEAYDAFAEVARAAEAAGADLAIVETMADLYELKAAVLACKENTSLPVVACATFQDNNLTLTGASPLAVVALLEGLGVDALGFNCGGDLAHARELAAEFVARASVPVIMEPNAGIPVVENGRTVFKVGPEEFAETASFAAKLGVRCLGGCCGTTPEHIAELVRRVSPLAPIPVSKKDTTLVSSWGRAVEIGADPVIVGERINPTGKKRFKEALLARDLDYVLAEGRAQAEAGAHVLDVNVGLPGIDERAMMLDAVRALQRTFPLPLQIDSSEPAVLESALRYYNGKALVNSVNGKREVMDAVFPIVRKYGGVLVALALDENGIPPTAEGRLAIARKIVAEAERHGIPRKDVIVDTLTLTVSSQQKEAMETVRALALVKRELGVKTILGVSNISFGLPERETVNAVFFASALASGLDACIVNPLSRPMMDVYRSWRALAGHDENCLEYIAEMGSPERAALRAAPQAAPQSARQPGPLGVAAAATTSSRDIADDDLRSLIVSGLRDRSRRAAELLLDRMPPIEVIDSVIVPALDEVGRDFESGRKFLPQLLLSADTVSRAFEAIKERLARSGATAASRGKILIATVKGDIHDIGKNIVKAMLENYGFAVVDLGKDVSPEAIVEAALRERPNLVGLSALMTTTVSSMEKTIAALREAGVGARIMVGGAVLTEDYAARIGADYYAKDAMASVAIAKEACPHA